MCAEAGEHTSALPLLLHVVRYNDQPLDACVQRALLPSARAAHAWDEYFAHLLHPACPLMRTKHDGLAALTYYQAAVAAKEVGKMDVYIECWRLATGTSSPAAAAASRVTRQQVIIERVGGCRVCNGAHSARVRVRMRGLHPAAYCVHAHSQLDATRPQRACRLDRMASCSVCKLLPQP
ncbi:hypothetical protein EON67_06390 [archaeon]|nr:MAG: hypothetical protein EON67_06390 [archaeon]